MQDTPNLDFLKSRLLSPRPLESLKETCECPLLAITNSSVTQPVGFCKLQSHPGHSSLRVLSSAHHSLDSTTAM